MNDVIGYRRGISYPYILFDNSKNDINNFYELPVCCMDLAFYKTLKNDGIDKINNFIKNTKNLKGLLVFDFHSDAFRSDFLDNVTTDFIDILDEFINDPECWLAKPTEVVNWVKNERWK